jgi:hypothetical protein
MDWLAVHSGGEFVVYCGEHVVAGEDWAGAHAIDPVLKK